MEPRRAPWLARGVPVRQPSASARPLPSTASTLALPSTARPLSPRPGSSRAALAPRNRKPGVRISCTHMTVTRVYNPEAVCDFCHSTSGLGWLYCCSVDLELLIQEAVETGRQFYYDDLSRLLSLEVKPLKGSAEEKTDPYWILRDMTKDQMMTYTPQQIAQLLEQRENVQDVAETLLKRMAYDGVNDGFPSDKPWVPRRGERCNAMACPKCRPKFGERSDLSINGVLSGEVLPSVATGLAFIYDERRPVADVDIVRNLGCRPVPMIPKKPPSLSSSSLSETPLSPSGSQWSVMDVDGGLKAGATLPRVLDSETADVDDSVNDGSFRESAPLSHPLRSQLPEIPPPSGEVFTWESPDSFKTYTEILGPWPVHPQHRFVRPPWTPPPTPESWDFDGIVPEGEMPEFTTRPTVSDGRSPASFKTNPRVRRETLYSFILPRMTYMPPGGSESPRHVDDTVPYGPEESYDVGLFLPLNHAVYATACATPLPPPADEEIAFLFAEGEDDGEAETTPMEDREAAGGWFSAEPLDVPGGVAVLEESVECGMADIITQV